MKEIITAYRVAYINSMLPTLSMWRIIVATQIAHKFYSYTCTAKNLLSILSSFSSCPTWFGLDEKIDKEKTWEESSEKNSKVSSELNLKGNRGGWHGLDDGVHGESWWSDGSSWDGTDGGLLQADFLNNYK